MKNVPLVTEDNFRVLVLESPIPVLLDFGAAWCGPCRAIEPILEKIAALHPEVRVLAVDADASAEIAATYRVRALPTLITFVGGKELARHTGATSMEVILRLLPSSPAAHAPA